MPANNNNNGNLSILILDTFVHFLHVYCRSDTRNKKAKM